MQVDHGMRQGAGAASRRRADVARQHRVPPWFLLLRMAVAEVFHPGSTVACRRQGRKQHLAPRAAACDRRVPRKHEAGGAAAASGASRGGRHVHPAIMLPVHGFERGSKRSGGRKEVECCKAQWSSGRSGVEIASAGAVRWGPQLQGSCSAEKQSRLRRLAPGTIRGRKCVVRVLDLGCVRTCGL